MFPHPAYPPLPEHILAHGRDRPDHPAIIYGERTIAYGELVMLMRRGATGLRAAGAAPGDRVMVAAPDKVDLLLGVLCAMAAGLPVMPVSGREEDVGQVAAAFQPRLVITGSTGTSGPPDMGGTPQCSLTALLDAAPGEFARVTHADIGLLILTSGTTGGERRGAMQSHRALSGTAQFINERMGVDDSVRDLVTSPLEHGFGMGRSRCALHLGGTIVLQPGLFTPGLAAETMRVKDCSMLSMSVPVLSMLLDTQAEALAALAGRLRWIEIGSSHLKPDRRRKLLAVLPHTRCFVSYGLTEAIRSTFVELNAEADKIDTVGRPTPWVRVRVVDDDNHEVATGSVGRIQIDGVNKASGYYGYEAAWQRKLVGDWLDTGDLGTLDADGYLSFIGRVDDTINVGGLKVAPEEVEEALVSLLADTGFAVAAVADPAGIEGFVPALFVETEEVQAIGIDRVRDHLRDRLPPFKIPRVVHAVPAFPRTAVTGKVRRGALSGIAEAREAARIPRTSRLIAELGDAGPPHWPAIEGQSSLTRRRLVQLLQDGTGSVRHPVLARMVAALRAAAVDDDRDIGRVVCDARVWLPAERDTVLSVGAAAPDETAVLGAMLHVLASGGRCILLASRANPLVAEDLGWIARGRARHVLLDTGRFARLAAAEAHLGDAFAHPEFEQVVVTGPPPDSADIVRFHGAFGFAPRHLSFFNGVWSTRPLKPAAPAAGAEAVWLQLREIAASVFQCGVDELAPEASADNTRGWDSLSFINLILEVETAFGRRLTPTNIMTIKRLGDFVTLLEARAPR